MIANEDVMLYALDKDPFVLVLTGHPAAHDTAQATAVRASCEPWASMTSLRRTSPPRHLTKAIDRSS